MMNTRKFHIDGSSPTKEQVFVFGSNLAGFHGAGAARAAVQHFGAKRGVGIGRQGQSFAIPTKDQRIETLPIAQIALYIGDFIRYTKEHDDEEFFVTRVGCGLAGYSDEDIAPLFRRAINCSFAEQWREYLE